MTHPGPVSAQPARLCLGLVAAAALTACSEARPDADRLELATISRSKEVPKSSPRQFVGTFDRFCAHRPAGMAAMDEALRAAGYVPRPRGSGKGPTVYVVDDKRPAVVVSERVCGVRAIARTGQTERVNRYVAEAFPAARPADTAALSADVEQAWTIPGGLIATARNDWAGNRAAYSLILFKPDT